jgi:hypothetical protein
MCPRLHVPAANSSPMLRLASRLRRSFSVILDIYCLSNFLQNLAWYRLSNALCIHREQPDLTVGQTVVVDHAYTRALAFAFTRPSHLAATAGALDHLASIWRTASQKQNSPSSSSLQ